MNKDRRFYEAKAAGSRRSAPAASRNRRPIADVLKDWLPQSGLVLEVASGTGEHCVFFAELFETLLWQPSDRNEEAVVSIAEWREVTALTNVRPPLMLDASSPNWPIGDLCGSASRTVADSEDREPEKRTKDFGCSAVLCINMVHIAPWSAALGLLDGAAKALQREGVLILYGPWLKAEIETAPSNLEFDRSLRERDPAWGLRHVEDFETEAAKRGFQLERVRKMPANNLMLLFRLGRKERL